MAFFGTACRQEARCRGDAGDAGHTAEDLAPGDQAVARGGFLLRARRLGVRHDFLL
jgi:hypothetical protein